MPNFLIDFFLNNNSKSFKSFIESFRLITYYSKKKLLFVLILNEIKIFGNGFQFFYVLIKLYLSNISLFSIIIILGLLKYRLIPFNVKW